MAKEHFAYFDEAPAGIVASIALLGQKVARVMKPLYGVDRVAFLFTGGDIAHVHAHVVPMHEQTDITSSRHIADDAVTFRPMPRASDRELAGTARERASCLATARSA